jgi:hypothetical protein
VDNASLAHSGHDARADTEETPHACMDGWVFLGFEGADELGEYVEVIERVPCRRYPASSETL